MTSLFYYFKRFAYALSFDMPKNISVCSGVFSGLAKCTVGGFFRGGGCTGIVRILF